MKKEAKLARKVLPQAKYHPKKDICQRKNPISVGLELGLTKLQIFVTEVVTNPQKPCDKSRRRFFKNPVTKVVAEPSRST